MKCPYCQEEMMEGYIYSGKTDICWTPISSERSLFINLPNDDQVLLAKFKIFKGCRIKVYRCQKCQIEIINEKDL